MYELNAFVYCVQDTVPQNFTLKEKLRIISFDRAMIGYL